MKKKLWVLVSGAILMATLAYAGNGDLIVIGNVGVGTNYPGAKLDVNGLIRATGITTNQGGSGYYGIGDARSDTLPAADLDFNRSGVNSVFRINNHTGISMSAHSLYGGIRFYNQGYSGTNTNAYDSTTGAKMVMAINNGNVGIGTANPGAKLDVNGLINATGITTNQITTSQITTNQGGSGYFGTGDVASNALPATDLDYYRAGGNPVFRINNHTGISMSAHSLYGGIRFYNQGYGTNTNPYDSTTGAKMVMAINNGIVLIGTTTDPYQGAYTYGECVYDSEGFCTYTYFTVPYKLLVNGNALATHFYSTSDERFKKNIMPVQGALATLLQMEGVSYEWKKYEEYKDLIVSPAPVEAQNAPVLAGMKTDTTPIKNKSPETKNFPDGRQYGVLAQAIEKVLPEVVKTDPTGEKAVNYSGIIPILIEAVKEQQAMIAAQQKLIDQHQKQLDELRSLIK